jgi:hypothetical protein
MAQEGAVRISSVFFGVLLSIFVSGCSTVTEKDLAELQSLNAIVKKEAVHRISRRQDFLASWWSCCVAEKNPKICS